MNIVRNYHLQSYGQKVPSIGTRSRPSLCWTGLFLVVITLFLKAVPGIGKTKVCKKKKKYIELECFPTKKPEKIPPTRWPGALFTRRRWLCGENQPYTQCLHICADVGYSDSSLSGASGVPQGKPPEVLHKERTGKERFCARIH